MAKRGLTPWIDLLEREGELVRVREPISAHLEIAAVQQRVLRKGGPALLFEQVKEFPWPVAALLYGTPERAERLLSRGSGGVSALIAASGNPLSLLKAPRKWGPALRSLLSAFPRKEREIPEEWRAIDPSLLPGIRSWPGDGGLFWMLPQVYSEHPDHPGWLRSNLGMYRIQVNGNDYSGGAVGMHYQLRRGIGVHHKAAQRRGEPLRVSVFLGGNPAHALAAVMPLPEFLPEIAFAGALAGRRFRYTRREGALLSTDADFVITGTVDPSETLPEGPFGDHLGYYSLRHPMPVLRVERAWARNDAVFPITVVARPPQEDSIFGALVHKWTAAAVPSQIPGVKEVHAVDETGVHPLLLVLGSERDVPYEELKPRELLTQACAVLGYGQLSLAKVVVIADGEGAEAPRPSETAEFLRHVLERIDWSRDIRFLTEMPGDTLDYTGGELHGGSKCIWSVTGPARRELGTEVPADLPVPEGFGEVRVAAPGILVVGGPAWSGEEAAAREMERLGGAWSGGIGSGGADGSSAESGGLLEKWPLIAVADDPAAAAGSLRDFLWTVFTRIDPASDITGVEPFLRRKHWGCRGPLLLDARAKSHHAPPVEPDPATEAAIDRFFAPGASLERFR